MTTIFMIFLGINCPNFIGLVWRRYTKFPIGMAAAMPAIPLPARLHSDPLLLLYVLQTAVGVIADQPVSREPPPRLFQLDVRSRTTPVPSVLQPLRAIAFPSASRVIQITRIWTAGNNTSTSPTTKTTTTTTMKPADTDRPEHIRVAADRR